jgi:hypothetical protein
MPAPAAGAIDGGFARREIGASRIEQASAPPTSKKLSLDEVRSATSATFISFRPEPASVTVVIE